MKPSVAIARIVKTRGVRGEVAAELLTDFPERFSGMETVRLESDSHSSQERLEDFWFHQNRIILKFAGRNRPEEVSELIGCEIRVPEEERIKLPAGTYYNDDLKGCAVWERQELLGQVVDLFKAGEAAANLVVRTPEGRELMIPMVSEIVQDIDVAERRIRVVLPRGLRELASDSIGKKGSGGDARKK